MCGLLLVSILVAYCIMIVKEKKYFRINKYLKNGKKFPLGIFISLHRQQNTVAIGKDKSFLNFLLDSRIQTRSKNDRSGKIQEAQKF